MNSIEIKDYGPPEVPKIECVYCSGTGAEKVLDGEGTATVDCEECGGEGQVAQQSWTTEEMQQDFEVLGFSMGFVVVRRRADGRKGSLHFTHSPRFYFGFVAAS